MKGSHKPRRRPAITLENRRKEVQESQANWRSLKPAEQLLELDKRLGKDQGAVKQRNRIKLTIAEASNPKPKKGVSVEKAEAQPKANVTAEGQPKVDPEVVGEALGAEKGKKNKTPRAKRLPKKED
jgi:hypothetical protein